MDLVKSKLGLSITTKFKMSSDDVRNQRATAWSVTINNPNDADEECISFARQKGWRVIGQKERGEESGTEHYQLAVLTPQVRFAAVKKAFPRGHIEPAKSRQALLSYVVKDETRISKLKDDDEKYPSQARVWEWYALSWDKEEFEDWYRQRQRDHYNEVRAGRKSELPRYYDASREWCLDRWDDMINEKIKEGYYVELIGQHPQLRACVRNYGFSILEREQSRIAAEKALEDNRQTDKENEESAEENVAE